MLEHVLAFLLFGVAVYFCAVIIILLSIVVEQIYLGSRYDD